MKRIKVIGKRGTEEPFRITGQKGDYLFISARDIERLLKINEAYKALSRGRAKVKPLSKPKIVGRGGVLGFKLFLVRGERCLCILAEDFERLRAVNEAYREL